VSAVPDSTGLLDTKFGQTRVLYDGVPAPILFARADQVNAIVPSAVAERTKTRVPVEYRGLASSWQMLSVAESAPGLFTVNGAGSGQVLALNQDGSPNSAVNPAPRPVLPVTPLLGGQAAEVSEAVSVPGLAGMLQVKVRVPGTVAAGSAVPVTLKAGSAQSQAGVTLVVQ